MSLVGFKARNHDQQVAKRGANDKVDDRATTAEVFDPLHELHRFTIDVAAAAHNTKCERFYSIEDDGLSKSWAGERVWMNPPYSEIAPWVAKAVAEMDSDDPPELIVMLLPANRTEQGWWQDSIEPYRDDAYPGADWTMRVRFLRGRLRFIASGDTEIRPNQRPPFGCCLVELRAARISVEEKTG